MHLVILEINVQQSAFKYKISFLPLKSSTDTNKYTAPGDPFRMLTTYLLSTKLEIL